MSAQTSGPAAASGVRAAGPESQTTGPAGCQVPAGPVPIDDARRWVRDRADKLRAIADVPASAPVPLYGSDEWQQLPDNDARRWLSALRAAEAWRHDRDPHVLAARLDVELDAAWRDAERDYAGWHQLAAQVRSSATVPDHAELQRRRREARTPEGQEVA